MNVQNLYIQIEIWEKKKWHKTKQEIFEHLL